MKTFGKYKIGYDGDVLNKDVLISDIIAYSHIRGVEIDIDNPVTIQDKINWLKIYDVSYKKALCSDKVRIHEYSKDVLGKDICVPLYYCFDDSKSFLNSWDLFPDTFVVKVNNSWNANYIIDNKFNFSKYDIADKLNEKMNDRFGETSLQLHYSLIEPKILVEKYIGDFDKMLIDYKFWCFNGEPKLYTVNSDNFHKGGTNIIYYDMNHVKYDVYECGESDGAEYHIPQNFDVMVEYSKKLSEGFKFCRVDFYEVGEDVYLSELTFTPGNGFMKYADYKYSKMIGDILAL